MLKYICVFVLLNLPASNYSSYLSPPLLQTPTLAEKGQTQKRVVANGFSSPEGRFTQRSLRAGAIDQQVEAIIAVVMRNPSSHPDLEITALVG